MQRGSSIEIPKPWFRMGQIQRGRNIPDQDSVDTEGNIALEWTLQVGSRPGIIHFPAGQCIGLARGQPEKMDKRESRTGAVDG